MSRILSRESAFRTIYSKLYNKEFDGLEASDDLGEYDLTFYNELVKCFDENYIELQQIIQSNLKGVTIDRVYKIDLALIYLALVEIKHFETPHKIVINEIVELAKKYSTEKSSKFINGFLAGIVNG